MDLSTRTVIDKWSCVIHPRGGYSYLNMEVSTVMTPILGVFNPIGSLFCVSARSDLPPPSAEKISLSQSHLVPEILGPKVSLIFHQNVLFNTF